MAVMDYDSINTSLWQLYYPSVKRQFTAIPSFTALAILINNVLVLKSLRLMEIRGQFRRQHYFLVGLAFADLMTLLANTVAAATLIAGKIWLTNGLCVLLGLIADSSLQITACIHTLMCLERCVTILSGFRQLQCIAQTYAKCIVIIAVLMCFVLPIAVHVSLLISQIEFFEFYSTIPLCAYRSNETVYIVQAVMFISAPLGIQGVTHGMTIWKVGAQ